MSSGPREFVTEPGPLLDVPIPAYLKPLDSPMTQDTAPAAAPQRPQQWAVIEIFGRQRIAGAVSEQTFGGATFVRVDVPEIVYEGTEYEQGEPRKVQRRVPAHSCSYGPGAIYSIKWCDEATALLVAHQIMDVPLGRFELRAALEAMPLGDRRLLLEGDAQGDAPW
ncbi:MAG TPA: hypothetical protein PLB26_06795 [Rubrivivax sp.]|nr:hypothetical protein [Rubrivivax sp.]